MDESTRGIAIRSMADHVRDFHATQLSEQLEGVRQSLTRKRVQGDGHCQYRSVALQCPAYGSSGYARLRSDVVAHVQENAAYFMPFFTGNQRWNFNRWV